MARFACTLELYCTPVSPRILHMTEAFKTIGIVGRPTKPSVAESLKPLLSLLDQRKLSVLVEDRLADLIDGFDGRSADRDTVAAESDLAIVIGGDGSMLHAARTMAHQNTAVLGVNRGRLGFLTDILPEEIEQRVAEVLDGEFFEERRFLLEVYLERDGNRAGSKATAFNDVVVNSGSSAQMIEFELHIDDEFVYRQRADGLIVATPTGSTAYALSGGGPIMHPSLNAVVLVPMFPHTLTSRPIVIDGSSHIRLDIAKRNRIHPPVTCDGQVNLTARPGDSVHIYKKPHPLRMIHPLSYSFYASCRNKLRWGDSLVD